MMNLFKKNKKEERKMYKVVYKDGEIYEVVIDSVGLNNLLISLDCCGGEVISVEEIRD